MNSKERVQAALHHEEADRVPCGENDIDFVVVEELLGYETLYNSRWREKQALWDGRRDEIVADYGKANVDLVHALEWDYVRVHAMPAAKEYSPPQMTGEYSWLDEQGREIQYSPEVGNIALYSDSQDMTIDDLPDPDEHYEVDPSEMDAIRHVVSEIGDSHFIIGRSPVDGTFPFADTVGMQEYLIRMITDTEFVERSAELYVNRSIAYINAMIDAGVDAVMVTDDYSGNQGPFMGPERFRRFIIPGIERQVAAAHAKGAFFIKHTDGNTWPILDDLIATGIDGWHGIQPNIGMDLKLLKEKYGDKLCFFGGINCETLVEGTPDQAAAEVNYALQHAAPGGGLVIATGNVLQPGTQLPNYLAARQALRENGRYPINI